MCQYLYLTLLVIGSIHARINCPHFDGSKWRSHTCPHSSYCLYTDAQFGHGSGGKERVNTVDCGSPDNEVWTNTKTIEAARVPEVAKAIFPVENAVFCDQGHGRWCRVTLGPEMCRNSLNCKIIECRCNIDDCFGFMKTGGVDGLHRGSEHDLLAELNSSPNKTTEGGCNGATKLGGSMAFFLVLLKVVFL